MSNWLTATENGVRLLVRVQPKAGHNRVVGLQGDALKVRLTAPPVENAANKALLTLLAKTFGVPKKAVQLTKGGHGRLKQVVVEGVSVAEVRRQLGNIIE